jgi:hypothetical protein
MSALRDRADRLQVASFILGAAIESGFHVRSHDNGLEVASPRAIPREKREPLLRALHDHRDDILDLIAFLKAEEERGISWALSERGMLQ